ncbi:PspC domain-containing protein [Gordonia neofelifaecis]|uniref:PspC domain-containing protein n=1 Tax=Gordonia neofelifaecis NRRL B-59395 TaxID=644548 RepID=F1YFT9_9ACTN|nr:PspC domain-containing protein [Gordonia neofelifaecis]EGD56516.1 PspC domain-containing protein [Gordonia neofelifaecis NRRL B-59395]
MDTKTLIDLWNTRPVRRRSGKSIGGVCTGIGMRYRIDPTLVKVAFVVAALFGGSGILLYIAALVAFPAEDETAPRRIHLPHRSHRRIRHDMPWYWIVVAVIAVIILGNMGSSSPFWGTSGLLGLILMLGAWWLLYQRTPEAPAGTSADQLRPGDQPSYAPPVVGASTVSMPAATVVTGDVVPSSTTAGPDAQTIPMAANEPPAPPADPDAPPAWDPLGTARFAWDLPEPTPPPQPPVVKPPRSPLTPVFAGLALIAATIGIAARVLGGVDWFTTGRIAGLALAVLGVGMLIDALQRRQTNTRASGLVPLAMIVGVVAVVSTIFSGDRPSFASGGIGDRSWHPQSVSQLSDTYQLSVGTTTLDLRDVGPLDHDRTVEIRQGIGDMTIWLPDDVRVKTECSTVVGDQTCPEGIVNPDAKTPTLTVKANVNLGTVEMKQ